MKRLLITSIALLAGLLASFSARAQSGKTADEFHGHWYIGVQGGIGQTVGETSFGNLISPAANFNFGYRFTPVWGLRAGITGWQAKGAVVGPTERYKYNYLQGNVDVTVDICNIFADYRMGRTLNPYLFAGLGVNGGFNNDEAQALSSRFPAENLLWDGSNILPAGRFGIGVGIRLVDAVHFNIELDGNFLGDSFNSKRGSAVDWQLGARAGFTFNIGLKKNKGQKAAPAAAYTPAPAPAPAPEPEKKEPVPAAEPEKAAPVETVAETQPAPAPAPEKPAFQSVQKDVLFTIGKSVIRDSEKAVIAEVAELLKANPETKVTVTGHADEDTGSAERNMELSKERANNVAAALKEAGVPADRISVEYKGDTANPYTEPAKNRVAICVVAE